jgi:hypothetical protein
MIENYSLKSPTRKNYFGLIALVLFIGVIFIIDGKIELYSVLFSVIVLGIAILLILDKKTMCFYDNKVTLNASFLKSNKTYEFDYDSLKGMCRIFATRGGSFLSFSVDEEIYEKGRISFDFGDNFESSEQLHMFLHFLNKKGVRIYSKDEDFLIGVFNKNIKIHEEKNTVFDACYYVDGNSD